MNWRKYIHRGFRIVCAKFVGWIADGLEAFHDWLIEDVWAEYYAKHPVPATLEEFVSRSAFNDEWQKDWDDPSMNVYDEAYKK